MKKLPQWKIYSQVRRLPKWKIWLRDIFIWLDTVHHNWKLEKSLGRVFPFCTVCDIARGWAPDEYNSFPVNSKVAMFFYRILN